MKPEDARSERSDGPAPDVTAAHPARAEPANLLLLRNGEAALSDFGIAEDAVRRRVATDEHYWPLVAPELLARRPTPVQSDVWAMGCLLYRLLTGQWPFRTLEAIRDGRFEPPQRSNPQPDFRRSEAHGHAEKCSGAGSLPR